MNNRNASSGRSADHDIHLDEYIPRRESASVGHIDEGVSNIDSGASELTSRILSRVIPLVYGALLGGLAETLWFGLLIGGAVAVGFDLKMGQYSLLSALLGVLRTGLCWVVTPLTRIVASAFDRVGLMAPESWRKKRCGAYQG